MTQPDLNLYPDEQHKLEMAYAEISRRFEFTEGVDRAIFNEAVQTEFAKAGFVVSVDWQQLYKNGTPTDVWLPNIGIEGRVTDEEEHDHDRHKWGVVKGLADGQAGYVREDGSKHEEPVKKIIY